jgi:hypothetical protein
LITPQDWSNLQKLQVVKSTKTKPPSSIIFKYVPADYNACVECGISCHLIDLPSHSILLPARRCFQEQQHEIKEATIGGFPLVY